jgi:hypothetical protein
MLKVIVKMRNGMAVTTTSKQEAGVAARLTHRARMRPQEEALFLRSYVSTDENEKGVCSVNVRTIRDIQSRGPDGADCRASSPFWAQVCINAAIWSV